MHRDTNCGQRLETKVSTDNEHGHIRLAECRVGLCYVPGTDSFHAHGPPRGEDVCFTDGTEPDPRLRCRCRRLGWFFFLVKETPGKSYP